MNERDISQTPNKKELSQVTADYSGVEIHDFDLEDTTQRVYLSPDTVGIVSGLGELRDEDNQPVFDSENKIVLVGEVTIFAQDGKATTLRNTMEAILTLDTKIREERQRQATVGKSMAGVAFKGEQASYAPVTPPELPPHPDDGIGHMVSRRDVLDMLAREQTSTFDQADMIEVPREFVPEGSTAGFDQIDHSQNVPYKGIPASAMYAPGSIYDPDRAEKDALGRYMQKTSEHRNTQE